MKAIVRNNMRQMLQIRQMLREIANQFEEMPSVEVYQVVNQAVTNLLQQDTQWTLALGQISRSIQVILNELPPVRAAAALDMVLHNTPTELRRFLNLTNFGRREFTAVRESMLLLNRLLVDRVETNQELGEVLRANKVVNVNAAAIKNFRLFISGLIGTASVKVGRELHRHKDKLSHNKLSIETVKFLTKLRQHFNSLPMTNTFSNACPITLMNVTRDIGIMVITFNPGDDLGNARIAYYSNEATFNRAWAANRNRCPISRHTNNMIMPLTGLTEDQLLSLMNRDGELQEGALGDTPETSYARAFFDDQREEAIQPQVEQRQNENDSPWSSDDRVIQLMIQDNVIGDGDAYEYSVADMRGILANYGRFDGRLRLMYSPNMHHGFPGSTYGLYREVARAGYLSLREVHEQGFRMHSLQPNSDLVIREMQADHLIGDDEAFPYREIHVRILLEVHENNCRIRQIFAPNDHPLNIGELRGLVGSGQFRLQQVLDMHVDIYNRLGEIYQNAGDLTQLRLIIESENNPLTLQQVLGLESLRQYDRERLVAIYSNDGQAQYYRGLIQNGIYSLQEVLNMSDVDFRFVNAIYHENGDRHYLNPLIGNDRPFTLREILALPYEQIRILDDLYGERDVYPGIRAAVSDGVVTFPEIFELSSEYYDFFDYHYNSEENRATLVAVIQSRGTDSLQVALDRYVPPDQEQVHDDEESEDDGLGDFTTIFGIFSESNPNSSNNNQKQNYDEPGLEGDRERSPH